MATNPQFDRPFGVLAHEPEVERGASSELVPGVEPCACGLALDHAAGHVYNEEAFRYFLDVERLRGELVNRPFLLLLVDLRKHSLATLDMDSDSAARVFAALAGSLRETDFVGWYRARSVIGAVLTQHADSIDITVQQVVRDRVVETLRTGLPSDLADRLMVRVYRLPALFEGVS